MTSNSPHTPHFTTIVSDLRKDRCFPSFRQELIAAHSPHNYQNRYHRTSLIQCDFRFYPKNQNNRRFDQSRSIY